MLYSNGVTVRVISAFAYSLTRFADRQRVVNSLILLPSDFPYSVAGIFLLITAQLDLLQFRILIMLRNSAAALSQFVFSRLTLKKSYAIKIRLGRPRMRARIGAEFGTPPPPPHPFYLSLSLSLLLKTSRAIC